MFREFLDAKAKEIVQNITERQQRISAENGYFRLAYLIFGVLQQSNLNGIIPPSDITDVLKEPYTRTPTNFSYNIALKRDSDSITSVVRAEIIRAIAREFGIAESEIRKRYKIEVAASNILISSR